MIIKQKILIPFLIIIILVFAGCELIKPLPGKDDISLGKEGLGIDNVFDKTILAIDGFSERVRNFQETGDYKTDKKIEVDKSLGFKVVKLESVIDSGGSGTAERVYKDSQYTLKIIAELPVVKEGFHYEGWVIKNEPLDLKSVGNLIYETDKQYHLNYIVNSDFMEYKKVVITLEADTEDNLPAIHYLEGVFLE
jgi:hypothetical protein